MSDAVTHEYTASQLRALVAEHAFADQLGIVEYVGVEPNAGLKTYRVHSGGSWVLCWRSEDYWRFLGGGLQGAGHCWEQLGERDEAARVLYRELGQVVFDADLSSLACKTYHWWSADALGPPQPQWIDFYSDHGAIRVEGVDVDLNEDLTEERSSSVIWTWGLGGRRFRINFRRQGQQFGVESGEELF